MSVTTVDTSWAVKHIIDSVLSVEAGRLNNNLTDLIEENNALRGDWQAGVHFMGRWFMHPAVTKPQSPWKPPMDVVIEQSLFEKFSTFDRDRGIVARDKEKFEQGFHRLMRGVHTSQDFLDVIPELTHRFFSESMDQWYRQKPESFTLLHDPAALARWEKLVDRMRFYDTMRLLY